MKFYREANFKETQIGEIPNDWDVIEVGDLGEVITGATPSTFVKQYWNGEYPFVTPTDMTEGKYVNDTERRVTEKGLEKGRLIPKDSVLVTCIASVGKIALASEPCITNQQINAIICKEEADPHYVYYATAFRSNILKTWAGRTTNPIVKKSLFEKFPLALPKTVNEQQKIAEVLSTVDEAIQKTSEVIAKTERLKKGLMQELLTKGIGRKEFKDTEIGRIPNEWKVVRIENLGEVVTGTTPSTSVKEYWSGEYPFVTPTDFSESKYVYSTERKVTKKGAEKGRLIPRDSVLVVCIGSTIGKISLAFKECITNQQINTVICKEDSDPHYVYYAIALRKNLLRAQAGITAKPIVKKSVFEKFLLPLPPLQEQREIAELLSTVDKKLELERNENTRSERIKQGMMDLLLTGKIRIKVS